MSRSSTPGQKLRIHVQESLNAIDGFRVTRERFENGLPHYQDVESRIAVTFGSDRAELDRGLADAEVLLAGNFESDNLRRRAPSLRWIQSIFAGVEKLLPVVPESVTLTNASGVHAPKAAEFVQSALLMLHGAALRLMSQQRRREWNPIFTTSIAHRTAVVVGTGSLGTAAADAAVRLGMRVLGISRSGEHVPPFEAVRDRSQLHATLAEADFLVVALPQTPATRAMIGAADFASLKPGAGFISIGRGSVVDEAALVEALSSGHLGGAVLDVFQSEPLPAVSPLWGMDNVAIFPHCGVDDLESYVPHAVDLFLRNVRCYLNGDGLQNVVSRDLGY
jgi:phosphoglycerate dehydrogenase-like enzyme